MTGKKTIQSSYRTLVGVLENGHKFGAGTYLLDSNDTSKYYGIFAVFSGMAPQAEQESLALLASMVEPYSEVYKRGELSRPGAFLKQLIGEFIKLQEEKGLVEAGSARHSFAIALVKNNAMYIGRINECPVFFLKDRKFRKIFKPPKGRGVASIQVEGISIGDGDKVVLSNEDMVKNLTKLEVRNILTTEDDLNLACNKINMLANKYEETQTPRLLIIKFKQLQETSQAILNKRYFAVFGAMAILIMLFFLWGDIVSVIRMSPVSVVFQKNRGWSQRVVKSVKSAMQAQSYDFELVYDKLLVPYDVAIAKDGTLYIIDDAETQIIKYNPASGSREKIGRKVKLSFPTGIDVLEDKIYVADFSVNKVYIFRTDGSFAGTIPDSRSYMVRLINPKSVKAVGKGSERIVYVSDRGNNRLLKFDHEGTYLNEGTIKMPSGFSQPNGLAVTRGGIIYLTLKISGQVGKISSKNIVTDFLIFQEGAKGSEEVRLSKPSGIEVDNKGNVYICDTGNQRIVIANQMGKLKAVLDRDKVEDFKSFYPLSIKMGPQGDYIYIVASNRYKYNPKYKSKCKGKIWRMKI